MTRELSASDFTVDVTPMSLGRFNLRAMFGLTTVVCILSWILAAPTLGKQAAIVAAASLAGAEWGRRRYDDPIIYGQLAGAAATVGMVAASTGSTLFLMGLGSFFLRVVLTSLFVAPFGVLIGFLAGLVDWFVADRVARPARAERWTAGEPRIAEPRRPLLPADERAHWNATTPSDSLRENLVHQATPSSDLGGAS